MAVKRGANTEFKVVEIAGEDDYDFQSYDLGDARSDTNLSLSGYSLTIFSLDGSCSIKFNSSTKPAIPLEKLTWPSMVVFELQFTAVFLTNTSQSGKTLKLYIGEKT